MVKHCILRPTRIHKFHCPKTFFEWVLCTQLFSFPIIFSNHSITFQTHIFGSFPFIFVIFFFISISQLSFSSLFSSPLLPFISLVIQWLSSIIIGPGDLYDKYNNVHKKYRKKSYVGSLGIHCSNHCLSIQKSCI